MINSIISSISIALNAEFGDRYKNYKEEKSNFFIVILLAEMDFMQRISVLAVVNVQRSVR